MIGNSGDRRKPRLKPKSLIFYSIGVGILGYLIYNLDISTIGQSFTTIGWGIFWIYLAFIPRLTLSTLCVRNLLHGKVSFWYAVYNQLTGNSWNNIIPAAGLGGEPYKIQHFSQRVGIEFATKAVVRDRLIHMLTGTLFSSVSAFIMISLVPIEDELKYTIIGVASFLLIFSVAAMFVTISTAPMKFSGFILKKLKFLEQFEIDRLSKRRFLLSFILKFGARSFSMLELAVILTLLGYDASFTNVITVASMLSLSASVFFIVPQGMGVNEGGTSWAFVLLGLDASVGFSVGLIRRARIISFALLGVIIQVIALIYKKISGPDENIAIAQKATDE